MIFYGCDRHSGGKSPSFLIAAEPMAMQAGEMINLRSCLSGKENNGNWRVLSQAKKPRERLPGDKRGLRPALQAGHAGSFRGDARRFCKHVDVFEKLDAFFGDRIPHHCVALGMQFLHVDIGGIIRRRTLRDDARL